MNSDAQCSLDDIGEPLSATTFVVVDLETTGASPSTCTITEIGAVKTRGGTVLGEFQTLVDPGSPIPPMIVAMTGITDAMVMSAPRIHQVLPAFLEFLGDAVLVAHNARFDVGFLTAACREHGYRWPAPEVVDTLTLARRTVTKEEAPNKKLGTLARVFGTRVTPTHRALDDARATGEILHGMLERLAAYGITHRSDLGTLHDSVPDAVRRKATLAAAVPAKPGVYTFRGPRGERLYVGTSKNLRARVKSYFTKAETRRPIRDMLGLAVSVDTIVCPTPLEANVLEVRLIAAHRPPYNRRSARPERTPWVRLTDEPFPRLKVSRSASADGADLGPLRSASDARRVVEAFQQALGVRTCTTRLPQAPRSDARACILKDVGRCAAPCLAGEASGYDATVQTARAALRNDISPVVSALAQQVAEHASTEQFERAADLRDAISALVDAAERSARLASLRACSIVAVRRVEDMWELVSAARGALVGSARVGAGVWDAAGPLRDAWNTGDAATPRDTVDSLDTRTPLIEEQELILRWLDQEGTRLLYVDGQWASPLTAPGRHHRWVDARRRDRDQMSESRS